MKNTTIALLSALCLLASCGQKTEQGAIPVFDVQAAIDNKKPFDLLDIANSLEFIPLQRGENNEYLVGNIRKIAESADKFYLSDGASNPIKVFSKEGVYLSSVGSIGRGANQMPFISDFTVDYRRDAIYAYTSSVGVIAYNTQGEIFAQNDSIKSSPILFNDGELVQFKEEAEREPKPESEKTLLEIFSPELKFKGSVKTLDKGATESLTLSTSGGTTTFFLPSGVLFGDGSSLFVKETLSDTVFSYQPSGVLTPAYRLDMGRYFIPAEAFGPAPEIVWNEDYHSIIELFPGQNYILIYLASYADGSRSSDYLILDKSAPADGFMATGRNHQSGLFLDGIKFKPMYVRDNRLVGFIESINIVDNAEQITDPDLKALAATLTENDNPVIVVMKLKK
ncbi:MAG: 6-bladed beta-propeller [Rikenellaceae bacterium]|jgi:hypothetical protein|nr:6-bladed beta-propeller [Rikenellaceae bacterium]